MIGAWEAVVFDRQDPEVLAVFYEEVLEMVRVPPEWPGHLRPQQADLDIKVRDIDPQRHPFRLVTWRTLSLCSPAAQPEGSPAGV